MTHLNVDEIITFVSFDELSEEMLSFSAKVNGHIRSCEECRRRVYAFQSVYDELCRISGAEQAKESLYHMVSEDELVAMQAENINEALDSFENEELRGFIG